MSERLYIVTWHRGIPSVEGVNVGERENKATLKDGSKVHKYNLSRTIKGAIEKEVRLIAFDSRKQPWTAMGAMCRLRRLAKKLAKHHLITITREKDEP
jgi:hypothetical protein